MYYITEEGSEFKSCLLIFIYLIFELNKYETQQSLKVGLCFTEAGLSNLASRDYEHLSSVLTI